MYLFINKNLFDNEFTIALGLFWGITTGLP